MAFKCDGKCRKESHYFTANHLCKQVCERCSAVRQFDNKEQPMTYKHFDEDAPYMKTIITHRDHVAQAKELSPWSYVGWQIENTPYDWLHVCYLGTGPGHVASVLKMLQLLGYGYEPGESDEMFLRRTTLEMRETCREHKRSDLNRILRCCSLLFVSFLLKPVEALPPSTDPINFELLPTGGLL